MVVTLLWKQLIGGGRGHQIPWMPWTPWTSWERHALQLFCAVLWIQSSVASCRSHQAQHHSGRRLGHAATLNVFRHDDPGRGGWPLLLSGVRMARLTPLRNLAKYWRRSAQIDLLLRTPLHGFSAVSLDKTNSLVEGSDRRVLSLQPCFPWSMKIHSLPFASNATPWVAGLAACL